MCIRDRPGADANAFTIAYSASDRNANRNVNRNGYTSTDCNADTSTDCDTYSATIVDAHPATNCNTDRNTNNNAYGNANHAGSTGGYAYSSSCPGRYTGGAASCSAGCTASFLSLIHI